MESRLANQDLSFDGLEDDDDDAPSAPSTYLPDCGWSRPRCSSGRTPSATSTIGSTPPFKGLDERSKIILRERWLAEKKQTLHELAEQFGVSAERIRQIEKNAMKKLRLQLEV